MGEAMAEEPDRLSGAPHPRETRALLGQDAAIGAFDAAAASGRLPHAWLIVGPRGTGKATLAWHIARALLGGAPHRPRPLAAPPEPALFRQVAALAHPGLFLCRRPWDEARGRLRGEITVAEVRALRDFFRLTAADGGARVAIIDAADELNASAANALLKLVEEPPPRATLILVSHQPAGLLPTIRSRCRPLRCRPLAPAPLAEALALAGAAPPADPLPLAELAEGSVGAAFRLLAEGGLGRYDEIAALLAAAPPLDRQGMVALAEAAAGRGAEARYATILDCLALAVGRLARAGAGAPITAVSEAERRAHRRLAPGPAQARLWAEVAVELARRTAHARAVRLDPAGVILDTLLQIDAAAGEAASRAA